MSDFSDDVTLIIGGSVLASIEPNIVDVGGGPLTVGGAFYCRRKSGTVAVAVEGGGETPGSGGLIRVYDGSVIVFNQQEAPRVVMSSDDEGLTDGGTIALHGPGAGVQGSAGANIVLNAAKRSVVIRDKIGGDVVRLDGEEREVIVRDKAGKNVFRVDGGNAALYIGAKGNEGDIIVRDKEGRDVFTLDGGNAALRIGVKDNEGDIIVRDKEGNDVFTVDGGNASLSVGADEHEGVIIVRDKKGKDVFTLDGKHAALYIGAENNDGDIIIRDHAGDESIRLNGNTGDITTKKERARKVDQDQHFDLFSGAQDGSFVVELAASYGVSAGRGGELFRGRSYRRWIVFTYKQSGIPFEAILMEFPDAVVPVTGTANFWDGSPEFSVAGANVRLSIPKVKQQEFGSPHIISDATLSVRALYGKLLSF